MFAKKPTGVKKNTKKRSALPAWIWMLFGSLLTIGIGLLLYLWNPIEQAKQEARAQNQTQGQSSDNNQTQSESASATAKSSKDKPDGKNSTKSVQAQTSSSEYEFYDLLPEQKVTPIPDEVVIANNTTNAETSKADISLELPTKEFDDDANFSSPKDTQHDGKITKAGAPVVTRSDDMRADGAQSESEKTPTSDPIATSTGSNKSYILQINSYASAEEADSRRAEVLLAGVDARVVERTGANGQSLYQVITQPYDNKTAAFFALDRLQISGIDALVVERIN